MSKKLILIGVVAAVIGGATGWIIFSRPALPPGFAGSNGRIEAKQIDVATKYPGRIKQVLADEGDTVQAGQVVATMDTEPLEAQLRNAEAEIKVAEDNRRTALAEVTVKQAEFTYAEKQYQRSAALVPRGAVSEQEAEGDLARMGRHAPPGSGLGLRRCEPNRRSMVRSPRPKDSGPRLRTVC